MRVVAAGVHHARQCVHIGAQGDPLPVVGADVAHQSRSAGQDFGLQTGVTEFLGNERGGGVLLAAQLGMSVQVTAPPDQIVVVGRQPGLDAVADVYEHARLREASSSTRSRSAGVCANRTTVRANIVAPSITAVSPEADTAAAANAG